MPILSAKGMPENFKSICCGCNEPITPDMVRNGEVYVVKKNGLNSILRCACCQDDYNEKFGGE